MKNQTKKIFSFILSVLMLLSCYTAVFASGTKTSCGGSCGQYPSLIIPGLFQSETLLYEDGKLAKDSNGDIRVGPFFTDTNEVIMDAVTNVLLPMAKTLVKQKDKENEFADTLARVVGDALMEKVKSDSNGDFVYDVRAVKYEKSVKEMSEYDKNWVYNAVPLKKYAEIAGEDHLYFYSYCSMDNTERLAKEIYDLVQKIKTETGHDKINIAPISQGGALFNAVLEYYPEVLDDINRIVYIVPAVDGSDLLGDIYAYGINDADDALYDYLLPALMKGQDALGYLINMVLRTLPKDVLNRVLDTVIDTLVSDYLVNSTALWSLIPQDSYIIAREKYLLGEEHDVIRTQTDRFAQAQAHAKDNIMTAIGKGIKVFDICGYNDPLYELAVSWDKEQADGIIQLDSTSLGATSVCVDTPLPTGYVQQNTQVGITCNDPTHNHIDPYKMVDASTGLLPDNTFYFYGHDHEGTGSCEPVINLATRLLIDESFTDVYSYPEEYPQFNNFVNSFLLRKDIADAQAISLATLSEETATELQTAIAEANEAVDMTNVDLAKFNKAQTRLKNATTEAIAELYPEEAKNEDVKSFFMKLLDMLMSLLNKALRIFKGDKGFFD